MVFSRINNSLFFSLLFLGSMWALGGCRTTNVKAPESSNFYGNLQAMCGKKYQGAVVFPVGREAPFQGRKIWLEINRCSPKEIRIPIYTDTKIYRTLILGRDATGIWLQHENKRPDGSQAEISMYGGQAADSKNTYLLVFPADSYSRQLLGADRQSVWSLSFSSDKTTLSYIAESNGRLDLQLDFDVTAAIQ